MWYTPHQKVILIAEQECEEHICSSMPLSQGSFELFCLLLIKMHDIHNGHSIAFQPANYIHARLSMQLNWAHTAQCNSNQLMQLRANPKPDTSFFSVTRRSRSDESHWVTYWSLALTLLMWPWWVMIPIEDFTDVILITLMALMTLIKVI